MPCLLSTLLFGEKHAKDLMKMPYTKCMQTWNLSRLTTHNALCQLWHLRRKLDPIKSKELANKQTKQNKITPPKPLPFALSPNKSNFNFKANIWWSLGCHIPGLLWPRELTEGMGIQSAVLLAEKSHSLPTPTPTPQIRESLCFFTKLNKQEQRVL